jgi:arylformamidase
MDPIPMIDATRPLYRGLDVWPGDQPFRLEWTSRVATGDPVNVGAVRMGVHTGTHLDAPFHLFDGASTVDRVPIGTLIGPATVVDARGRGSIGRALVADALSRSAGCERILFRTGAWAAADDRFPTTFPHIDSEAVSALREAGALLVGTDAPSVDPFESTELHTHRALLSAGICILENLLLDDVEAGRYDLIALPLRIVGADASPVRAILRPR